MGNLIPDESCYGKDDSGDESCDQMTSSRNVSPVSMEYEDSFFVGRTPEQRPTRPSRGDVLQSTVYFGSDSDSFSDGVLSPENSFSVPQEQAQSYSNSLKVTDVTGDV